MRTFQIEDLSIHGLYDPDTSNDSPAVPGLGSTCVSIVDSQVRRIASVPCTSRYICLQNTLLQIHDAEWQLSVQWALEKGQRHGSQRLVQSPSLDHPERCYGWLLLPDLLWSCSLEISRSTYCKSCFASLHTLPRRRLNSSSLLPTGQTY